MNIRKDLPEINNVRDFEQALKILKRRLSADGTLKRLKERKLYPRSQDRKLLKKQKAEHRRLNQDK